jgi:hypothetical protein
VKYLILIHGNPASQAIFEGLPDAERAKGLEAYAALTEDLAASGEIIVTEALADPATGKRVTAREGRITTTDGPFAEVKEHLAGFYLIDCDGVDRAIEIAARIPEAALGLVEVRPVRGLDDFLA